MSQFSNNFSQDEIRHQPGAQIPWRTIIEIMGKCHSHEEMIWYANKVYKNGWSRSMVINQIAMKTYERSLINSITTEVITTSNDLVNELFKDTYVFDLIKTKLKTKEI